MPEETSPFAPPKAPTGRWAFAPWGISTALLLSIAVAIVWFFELFWSLRTRIGMDEKMALGIAIGFVFIELYLIRRVMHQAQRARQLWFAARS